MARVGVAVILLNLIVVAITLAQSPSNNGSDEVSWAKRVDTGTEVVTTLQFYFHDTLSGRNPTAVKIADAAQSNNSLTLFGQLMMVDDALTEGPEATSKLLGRARGMYGSAAQNEMGLIMVLNYGFTDGIYNGSSFSILSLNSVLNPVREMTIVGGTGLFRLARGYAIAQTYWFDLTTGDAIVGYNVTLATYI